MKRKSKSIMKCVMTFVLTIAMVFGAVPLPFMPGSVVVHAADITLSGSESYTVQDGNVLTGSTSGTVTIADNAKITLSDVTITGGIVCEGSAEITLVGTNSVTGIDYQSAGIQIGGSGTTLTIKGDGSLTANGGYWSAGIGLSAIFNYDSNVSSGDIIIEGGTITAIGGNQGAGIGTGIIKNNNNDNSTSVQFGNITIKGGTVTATDGGSGDGIGKGYSYPGPSITFGIVTIYDGINMVDASSISESVTYMHDETDVTANASNYFTITEDGDRRIIAPKDDTDYTITIADDIEHGTLIGAATAKYMEKVTITATPDLGYRLSGLVVKDADNNDVATTGNSFFMPKGNVTVSAVFEEGTHGTTEFKLLYSTGPSPEDQAYETIYDGETTVNLQRGQWYQILKYDNEYSYRIFLLDNSTYTATIPYSGGTGTFVQNGTNFNVDYNGESGFYDITMTDVGNDKWRVSIQKTVPVIDNIPDQTYTGNEIKPEPQVMAGSLSLTKGTDYEYSYMDNTNVGTAKVIVTFKGDYASLGSVEKEFTIVSHIHSFAYSAEGATITASCSKDSCPLTDNKATLTINAPIKTIYGDANSASATLTGLDDFNSATSLNITETGIKYVGRGNTAYAESDTAPVNAGTYTASITAGSKTASVDYTIAPKPISSTGATATDRDYVKDSTSVEISACTFDGATLTNETDYAVTGAMDDDTAGDSKSVTVTVTLMNGNYTFGTNGNTTTTTVKIDKINHDGVSASGSAKYGAEGMVDLSSLIEAGGNLGTVSVSDTNNVLDGTPTIETDGKTLKFRFKDEAENANKTATVTIPVTDATNYNNYNIVVTLTVAGKTVPTLSVSDFTKTYDGNSVTISELTKTAKVGSSDVEGTWTFEGNPGLKDVSDSGSITVKFTPTDTANYESATATFMLMINRKSVTVKADNKNMVVGTTPAPELTATVSGTVGSDTVIYSLDREAGTVVGDYVITPSGDTLQGNYTVSYETGTFTITEDATVPVVKKAPKAITGLVYNGTAQALVEPGEAENGTMYYAVTTENTAPADNLYTTSNYTATNAGTYYVWYKVVGDANHNDVAAQVVTSIISDKPIATITTAPKANILSFTGSEQALVTAGAADNGTMQYKLGESGTYSTEIPKATNAGDYSVYYKVVGDSGYIDSAEAFIRASIAKAAVENKIVAETIEVTTAGVTNKTIDLKDYLVTDASLKETAKDGTIADHITAGSLDGTVFTYSVAANDGGLTGQMILAITSPNYADYTITINMASAKKVTEVVIENEGDTETSVGTVQVPDLSGFTDAQPETTVEVKMEVKLESTEKVEQKIGATVLNKIEESVTKAFGGVSAANLEKEYMDITVTKSVDGSAAQTVADVNRVLEIKVGYNMTGKFNPVVIREHGGAVSQFTRLSAKPATGGYQDGTFYVEGSGATANIYIYARYFSIYTVAYTTTTSYQVTFDDTLGSVNQVVVTSGNKVTKPADPSKAGYDFAGWYNGDTAWNFDTTVTGDMTLKAQWSEKAKETQTEDEKQEETNTEEQKTETPAKQVRSPKTNDRFPEYPFWIVLMMAGIAVSVGGFFSRKKSDLKNQE